jgi:DNA-directed RNA polymerase subunit RPC12/RpoP
MNDFGFFAPGPMELLIVGLLCAVFAGVPAVLLVVLLVNRNKTSRVQHHTERIRCPECAEWIMPAAMKCRFCGATVDGDTAETETPDA